MSRTIYRNRRDLGVIPDTNRLISQDYRRNVPVFDSSIITFYTNSPSTKTFDPTIVTTSGTLLWDLGDGTTQNANSFSYTYANSNTKTVKIYAGTSGATNIQSLDFMDDNIVGGIDLRKLTNCGSFTLSTNSELTDIICPNSTVLVTTFFCAACNIGTLDLRPLVNVCANISIRTNANLKTVWLPSFTNRIEVFRANDCAFDSFTVDNIFSKINAYFLTHTPTLSLTIIVNGGTNAPLTGGASNSDLVSLTSIFAAAGKSFTATYN